jgi:hypothetical protein
VGKGNPDRREQTPESINFGRSGPRLASAPQIRPWPEVEGPPPGLCQSRASGCRNRKAKVPLDFAQCRMRGQAVTEHVSHGIETDRSSMIGISASGVVSIAFAKTGFVLLCTISSEPLPPCSYYLIEMLKTI